MIRYVGTTPRNTPKQPPNKELIMGVATHETESHNRRTKTDHTKQSSRGDATILMSRDSQRDEGGTAARISTTEQTTSRLLYVVLGGSNACGSSAKML